MIKQREDRRLMCMGERNLCTKLGGGNKKRGTLGDEVQDGRTVLQLLFSNQNVRAWTRFIRPWRGTGFGLLFRRLSKVGCHKRTIFQLVAE
jgi:hypothetical protein